MFRKLFGKTGKPNAGHSATPHSEFDIEVDLTRIGGCPETELLFISPAQEDIPRALGGWQWLGLEGFKVVAVSAFGEPFLSAHDSTIYQLDSIEGRIRPVARSLADLTVQLMEAEVRDELLFGGLVMSARNKGFELEAGECYDFEVAPVLGGAIDIEHVTKMSFVVKLHIAGQLHEQVRNLPAGMRVNNIQISD